MASWAQILADIRTDLKDPSGAKYSDESLALWLKDAVRDYSRHFPLEGRAVLQVSGDGYALPATFVADISVESPEGNFLERREPKPGVKYVDVPHPTVYALRGGKLRLNAPTAEAVVLTFEGIHATPTYPGLTGEASVPDYDLELLRLYVKAKANEQVRTRQAQLDRFKTGSGSRDDNPLEPEVAGLMDEYRQKIAERYPSGTVNLYRPGARR